MVGYALVVAGISFLPSLWCGRGASKFYHSDKASLEGVSAAVERWVSADLGRKDFRTRSQVFDGEWLFGTYMMAGMGFGQAAILHPEFADRNVGLMELCIEKLLSDEVKAFEKESWGSDPIETLSSMEEHHAAYLGYFNLLLSMHRLLDPGSRFADLNDRISEALARRIEASPAMLLQTYPSERYPVDNCAVIASIGLYDKATGANHYMLVRRWAENCRGKFVDKDSGLLYQAVDGKGVAIDSPRGSGTALGLYFLSFSDPELSRSLFLAVRRELSGGLFGFGGVREYPRGTVDHRMDIDSGPIVMGYGLSSSGFSIAGARLFSDEDLFRRLYASLYLVGAPFEKDASTSYITGGPIGTAIVFAMLTALPESRYDDFLKERSRGR
jgi:hypothetical protein